MAYIYPINKNTEDSQQHSPAWVLTFVRWENRNPYADRKDSLTTRQPLVVINDCVSVSVASSKSSHTPTMNATLKLSDVNYMTSLAPGDFVFVNIVNGDSKAIDIYNRAIAGKQINKFQDGFKGFFKIQSVRKTLSVDKSSGIKQEFCTITGFAFTEFNNTIYFNPFLIDDNQKNDLLFITNISDQWNKLVGQKNIFDLQLLQKLLISAFIGTGLSKEGKKIKNDLVVSPNTHFFVPEKVGSLLGNSKAKSAKDIYNVLMGVQTYAGSAKNAATGFNPSISKKDGRFYETANKITGIKYLQAEYWNQVTLWSIMGQYLNPPMNEMYTCFRVSPEGDVMPTVVIRQTPHSSDKMSGTQYTRFSNLPRWKINYDLVYSFENGRDEAARINFVQVFGKIFDSNGSDISLNIAQKNYRFDQDDVKRSGLRPWIIYSNFDDYVNKPKATSLVPFWVGLMADSVIGQHLRLNGTMEASGIYEPIAVGDNLEFDGVVYHIESVSHAASINPATGGRDFTTTIQLSSGLSVTQSPSKFAEMADPDAQQYRDNKRKEGIMPGYADVQKIPSRPEDGEEVKKGSNKRFKG